MDDKEKYEQTVRSNESIRDRMDGKLEEPRMTNSMETDSEHTCTCGNSCNDSNCCSRG